MSEEKGNTGRRSAGEQRRREGKAAVGARASPDWASPTFHNDLRFGGNQDALTRTEYLRVNRSTAFGSDRHESNLDAPVESFRNPVQHCQRVPFVIGILQAANRRGARSHEFRQGALRQPGLHAQIVYFPGNNIVRPNPIQFRQLFSVPADIAPVEDFHSIAGFCAALQDFWIVHKFEDIRQGAWKSLSLESQPMDPRVAYANIAPRRGNGA